jgi:Mannosyltransferase (PIG-V)
MAAVRVSWRALWCSRLLVWVVGVGVLVGFGWGPARGAFNPPGVTRGFGGLGDLLAGPAARWDASWYLVIAHYGYRPDLVPFTAARSAFFPLYPLGIRGLAGLGLAPVLAGVLISLVAFALALYGVHRLAALELGAPVARVAVLLTAFAPMAFYFSAVYTESLYLALSVGVFWSARNGRFMWAGVLGALAAATRNSGVLLLAPVLLLYFHGPREDRLADVPGARLFRYRPRRDALWLLLIPLGVGAYLLYLGVAGGDALMPFHVQGVWHRSFAGPFAGVWDGLVAGFDGLRQLLSGQSHHVYFAPTQGSPMIAAEHNVLLLVFLLLAVPALVGVWRRLPGAYVLYALAALALPLSTPVLSQPLMSLPRFLVVLFPLTFWAAAWLEPRPRLTRGVLVFSALLMALFVAQFSTWHWVA